MMNQQNGIGQKPHMAPCHDNKIVIFGQSCVGKTHFAHQIDRTYVCFDALFPWHQIEGLGLSTSRALQYIKETCDSMSEFVLDGWHLSDQIGSFFPEDVCVYVLFASYSQIISQYRVKVDEPDQHRSMFNKWYSIEYPSFPKVRYWKNDGHSINETTEFGFKQFLDEEKIISSTHSRGTED